MKKKNMLIAFSVFIVLIGIICAIFKVTSNKIPFENLTVDEIESASVSIFSSPPVKTVEIVEKEEFIELLKSIEINGKYKSEEELLGGVCKFDIKKVDGTVISVSIVANSYITINEVAYKCQCEIMETLTDYANRLLKEQPKEEGYDIDVVIPAGNKDEYIFSKTEFLSESGYITLNIKDEADEVKFKILSVNKTEYGYAHSIVISVKESLSVMVHPDTWYEFGIAIENETEEDIVKVVHIDGVDIRNKE